MKVPSIPRYVYALGVAAMVLTYPASAAECSRPGENPIVQWSGAAAAGSTVRVYFRADLNTEEHFVEMMRETPTTMQAVLPRVSNETRRIDYRIVSVSGENERTLFSGLIGVSENCRTTATALPAANRIVLGADAVSQRIPAGFDCAGIVALTSSEGDLRAYRGCNSNQTLRTASGRTDAPKTTTSTSLARTKGRESFTGGKSNGNNRNNQNNQSNGSNGIGHVDHGNGNGYGHCKDHQGPANGHEGDETPCAPVSSARP